MAKSFTKQFFEQNKDERPHELIKRVMYKKYLQAFVPVTQKYYSTVIIDGFAGPGRYGPEWPSNIEEYGSPIIALIVAVGYLAKTYKEIEIDLAFDLNREIKVKKRHTPKSNSNASIRLYFVEDDKTHFKSLCENVMSVFNSFLHQIEGTKCFMELGEGMAAYQLHISLDTDSEIVLTCDIQNISFKEFPSPDIDTWKTRCLTFLDPFGYSDTPMKDVQKYVGEGKEVLINFMSSYVNRFVSGNFGSVAELFDINTHHVEKVARQANKSKEEVDDIIADFVKDFIRERPVETQENHPVKNITRNFEKVLKEKAGSDYSLIFEMRGKNNSIIYHLVFITNHIKGVTEMKESMNRCSQERDILGMSDYKIVRRGQKLSLINDQNPGDVANSIFQEFKGRRVRLQSVKTFVLLDTPYLFRKGVLKLMEKEEQPRLCHVRNIDHRSTEVRKAGTFPDWGTWELQFRADDEEHDAEFTRSM